MMEVHSNQVETESLEGKKLYFTTQKPKENNIFTIRYQQVLVCIRPPQKAQHCWHMTPTG